MSKALNLNTATGYHEQELRIALVMNGGVSLAVWIGGVSQEINRLVRGETLYGRLCKDLWLRPRVDVISGTSAGGINGALLALAMSQGKPLDPLRDIWRDTGDLLKLLREPASDDPPSLMDGGYFYSALLDGFQQIARQPGRMQPAPEVPIELTLTTTVLRGDVRDFPDDVGTLIRDVTHRGLLQFRRGPDIEDDPFASPDIVAKLAAAARCTASFPAAFEPFYLPAPGETATSGGRPVPSLAGHANFALGCFVVDGGVLDNNPIESAIDAIFQQRAEGEVRRVLAYVVPDPGHIADAPPEKADQIPTMASTVLASLVNIPRVESVSDQLRAITKHNQEVSRQRNTRVLIARSLDRSTALDIAEAVFPGYRLRRMQSAADYIAAALAEGAGSYRDAAGQGIALGRRARQRIADYLANGRNLPWVPDTFTTDLGEDWRWGLFTLGNIVAVLLDMLRRGVGLMPVRRTPATDSLWDELMAARRQAYDLVAEVATLRRRDRGHWQRRGTELAPQLAALAAGKGEDRLPTLLRDEIEAWIRQFDDDAASRGDGGAPAAFIALARKIGELLVRSLPALQEVLDLGVPCRNADKYAELSTLVEFASGYRIDDVYRRLLTLEVVHYAFGADDTRDQYLELVQFSANVATAFGGPSRLEDKLAGVQMGHFGAFYKRSWRINDWMFGRLDGAERLLRILLDPARLARLYGCDGQPGDTAGVDTVLALLHTAIMEGLRLDSDRTHLETNWQKRLPTLRDELAFLASTGGLPENLPQCTEMLLERLHLDILREELPALADAVGDDEQDGADLGSNGPKFLKRFRNALALDGAAGRAAGLPPSAADLPAEVIIDLFKGANVGKEKILDEAGTDRLTIAATRGAAIAVSAMAGKSSGLKGLRHVFSVARAPLVALDILVRALIKKSETQVFLALYGMLMAAGAVVLAADRFACANWYGPIPLIAAVVLAAGIIALLRRYPKLLATALGVGVALWFGLPFIIKCGG